MPKRTADVSLSSMLDSASEGDNSDSHGDAMPTPDSAVENAAPAKKGRGRTKATANKISNSKPSSRPPMGPPPKKAGRGKRAALQEQENDQHPGELSEADDLEIHAMQETQQEQPAGEEPSTLSVIGPKKRGRPAKARSTSQVAGKPGSKMTGEVEEAKDEVAQTARTVVVPSSTQRSKPVQPKRRNVGEKDARRTNIDPQHSAMEVDDMVGSIDEDELEQATPRAPAASVRHARSMSKTRPASAQRRRAGSGSDTEKGTAAGEAAIRRKLGEMTKKFENLGLKYRNLREIGVKEAENNFDRLRSEMDAKDEAASQLIASLKSELSTQTTLAKESRSLQKQLSSKDNEVAKLQDDKAQLSKSLADAQNENKKLSAKLAASRNGTVSNHHSDARGPGSAVKVTNNNRLGVGGSTDASQASRTAQLKEDLYSDLTGLILRGVKKENDSDVYDCIQTGRNGTFHFKLGVANDGGHGHNYEETEFVFTPMLDNDRDRALIGILPEYLTEEISFARENAGKFYARVMETLTKIRKHDDDE
ncbi:MAG: hypothetical protein M1833_004082 [Piccolia ochrophora]|nr:MAG: hypothetical protein M1833_004082 [Piccolia ochrophora]